MTEIRCDTCRHFVLDSRECRAHPPVPGLAGPFGDSNGRWPRVEAHDRCGEHAPLEPEPAESD